MLQLSEIVKNELLPAADTVKQCRIELASIERQIEESEAPARELEAEIENIRKAMDRGKALAVSDPIDFVKQGGDLLITELSVILESKLSYLADLRTDIANLQDTNWRLMSEGVRYRLGMLDGRLHGYEKEEDLVDLLRREDKKESKKNKGK